MARLSLLGVGAMRSPRFAPAGLLVECGPDRVMIDGEPGGHSCVLDVAREARARGVRRLVFAHIGRPTIRAIDAGECPPFGELGHDGQVFTIRHGRAQSSYA